MTTTEMPTASIIAHRRRRAAALMLAQDQAEEVVALAAFYAELMTRMGAGMAFDAAVDTTQRDLVLRCGVEELLEDPLLVPATARAVEWYWPWICGDDPMPADVAITRTPEAVEMELLEIAAFTPATALLTDDSAGVRIPAATGTRDAAVIAHRRRRAAALVLAHGEPPAAAAVAAQHADVMTHMAAGLGLEEATIASGVREDAAFQQLMGELMAHPMYVITAQRIVENCWTWICSDQPLPADVHADPATAVPPRGDYERFVSVTTLVNR